MLGQRDLLNEYVKHVGTGLFAVPLGLGETGDWYCNSLISVRHLGAQCSRSARESSRPLLWRSSRDWLLHWRIRWNGQAKFAIPDVGNHRRVGT